METTHRIETADARDLDLPENSVDLVVDPLFPVRVRSRWSRTTHGKNVGKKTC